MTLELAGMALDLDYDLGDFYEEAKWRECGEAMRDMKRAGIPRTPDNDAIAEEVGEMIARWKTFVEAGLIFATPLPPVVNQ